MLMMKMSQMDLSLFDLTLDDVELIIKRYVQDKKKSFNGKFRVISYQISKLSEEPIGYLGDHYNLDVIIKEKSVTYSGDEETDNSEERNVSFFMKILPEDVPKQAEYVAEMGCFQKEIKLFTQLLPRLQDISIGTMPFAAKSYLTKSDKLIVFENLQDEGFRIVPKNNGVLDFAHLEVALKAISKLHAASLTLEERSNKSISKLYPGHLKENAYVQDVNYVRTLGLENAINVLIELIKNIEKYQESEQLDAILEEFPNIIRKIYDYAEPSPMYRNVVNHADLWSNNLMFKYREVDRDMVDDTETHQFENEEEVDEMETVTVAERTKVPIDCRLVDFQLSRYAPPALDVLTLLMLTTNSEFREKHLEQLLDIYYDSLSNELSWHHYEVIDLIPETQFKESCKLYHLAGLIETCLFSHLTLLPAEISKSFMKSSEGFENFIKTSRVDVCLEAFNTDDNYKYRMSDMLTQIVDLYILN